MDIVGNDPYRRIHTALLGIEIIVVVQFLQLGTPLAYPLSASLYVIAVAVPVSAVVAMLPEFGVQEGGKLDTVLEVLEGFGAALHLWALVLIFAFFSYRLPSYS